MIISVKLVNHEYNVIIEPDSAKKIGQFVQNVWNFWNYRKIAIITDDNVAPLYLNNVSDQLTAVGFNCLKLIVKHGEEAKSLNSVAMLIKQMASAGFTRDDGVVALGGGVIGDLAGLTASLYMRGISYLKIATSLTAQVDSSVGGKTAVDLAGIKNVIGTFYQPDLVIVDPNYLLTLDDRNLVEGYAEVVKTSVLAGPDFFAMTGTIKTIANLKLQCEKLIERSISYKANIVMADEKEAGIRQFLNFGHTFGHPIESLNHGLMRHGEAVSIGMIAVTKMFEKLGISPTGLTLQLKKV
ncbi:3-dehydroquinate synthase [Xylocopilactobacillus apis]|uniref:3-dehydroquinate synthase n=1 Tax=Xylocopilactobacillus apis TaxID=2932183 RepID=A0AAU9DNH0_9LACO|nr:3-dehydroquinate synthase [Xylocopilactobacillus apis]